VKQFRVEITGRSPLILHGQDPMFETQTREWRKSPEARNSEKGDDRYPGFAWLGYLYHEDGNVVIPTDNLMACFREGGAGVKAGGMKTYKAQTQSGARIIRPAILKSNGKPIDARPMLALRDEVDFEKHLAAARDSGLDLFVKGVTIGKSRHIRVRPYISVWSADFVLDVWDPSLTQKILTNVWETAGAFKGIGDFRPGSPKSGRYGTFTVEMEEIVNG